MTSNIPSPGEVRAILAAMTSAQMVKLSNLSGVALMTLRNIRSGDTENPGIKAVHLFMPHIKAAQG